MKLTITINACEEACCECDYLDRIDEHCDLFNVDL